jgi:hypothetical protein
MEEQHANTFGFVFNSFCYCCTGTRTEELEKLTTRFQSDWLVKEATAPKNTRFPISTDKCI